METVDDIKCPKFADLLKQQNTLPEKDFGRLQVTQIFVNSIVNGIRQGMANGKKKIIISIDLNKFHETKESLVKLFENATAVLIKHGFQIIETDIESINDDKLFWILDLQEKK